MINFVNKNYVNRNDNCNEDDVMIMEMKMML